MAHKKPYIYIYIYLAIAILFIAGIACEDPKVKSTEETKASKTNTNTPTGDGNTILTFTNKNVKKLRSTNTYQQEVKVQRVSGDDGSISYRSSDDNIATVDANGVVTFKTVGKVTITATKAVAAEHKALRVSYDLLIGTMKWKKVIDAPWTAREGFASVVFDEKLWVMGGQKTEGELNDVWYSSDGVMWTEATSDAPWTAREGLTSVAFDGKIWIMGGCSGTNEDTSYGPEGNNCRSNTQHYYNDVWSSTDGSTWTEERANLVNDNSGTMWDTRAYHTSVVLNGAIYVIGGFAKNSHKWPDLKGMYANDIWSSTDGSTWQRVNTNTVEKWDFYRHDSKSEPTSTKRFRRYSAKKGSVYWGPRYGHGTVVLNNTLFIIGGSTGRHSDALQEGYLKGTNTLKDLKSSGTWPWKSTYKNDVWSSTDGNTWKMPKANDKNIAWVGRRNHATVVFENKIYLIGGRRVGSGKDRVSENDVWTSDDGIRWTEMSITEAFMSARDNFQAVEFDDRLYVMGGGAKKSGVSWSYYEKNADDQYSDVWAYGIWAE